MLRKYKRTIALGLLFAFLVNIFTPTVSYALTAGPTAPEYTSFEPVDTTDMVNLATGDLVYNIPLLEVPGPAGGYPLSLSYHAGILTNEEASWVGLGWSLNPGAITRSVNGYPDDQLGATRTRTDHNSGGERSTFSVGVGLPGASFGLSISNDSNLGIGIGGNFFGGLNAGGSNFGASIGVQAGADGYGSNYTSPTASLSLGASGLGIGLSTNFKTVSYQANFYFLGASLSSKGLKPSLSVARASIAQVNSKAGSWKTDSWGIVVPIPLGNSGAFLNLGYNYLRYYMHETSDVKVIGTLHAKESSTKDRDDWGFDSYALLDPDQAGGVIKNNDPEKSRGGSFPAYDNYTVNAQGLNGSIQPYIFKNGNLFRQNLKTQDENNYLIEYKGISPSFNSVVNFRFKNDFSNSYAYSSGNISITQNLGGNPIVTSSNSFETATPPDGLGNDQHLAGSKHIEWFTNQQIKDGVAKSFGFIDFQPHGNRLLERHGNVADQVGGFMITNESGVTYHYAIPVYAYDEFSKSFQSGDENDIYQTNFNADAYAYTWLLTAITGPDFIDRGGDNYSGNGILDLSDWGYWVKFDYGMWVDNYKWRNPESGAHKDLDVTVEFYSHGKKELYYLNTISTKTHTALFVKEPRLDSKGVVNLVAGGSQPVNRQISYVAGCDEFDGTGCYSGSFSYWDYPSSALKLNKILLLKNEDVPANLAESGGDNGFFITTYPGPYQHSDDIQFEQRYYYENFVIDQGDDLGGLDGKSIRIIELNHSHDLCSGVPNSFSDSTPTEKQGKLTLNELEFQGNGGFKGIPPMKFQYAKNPFYSKDTYDIWGLYKSDYDPDVPPSVSRFVTDASADNVDAWSLSKIQTSLGGFLEIKYESDSYEEPELFKSQNFNVVKFNAAYQNNIEYEISGNIAALQNYFKVNDLVDIAALHKYKHVVKRIHDLSSACGNSETLEDTYKYQNSSGSRLIKETGIKANGNFFIKVEDVDLYTKYTSEPEKSVINSGDFIRFGCSDGSYQDSPTCTFMCDGEDEDNDLDDTCTEPGTPVDCDFDDELTKGPWTFCAGNIAKVGSLSGFENLGGGLRVVSVAVKNLEKVNVTNYSYSRPGTDATSGMTAYEPQGTNYAKYLIADVTQEGRDLFESILNDRFKLLLQIAREVPAPGVIYQFVTVEEGVQNSDGSLLKFPNKKVYEFQTFDERMVQRIGIQNTEEPYSSLCKNEFGTPVDCAGGDPVHGDPVECYDQFGNPIACFTQPSTTVSPMTLSDFTSWVGALKSISVYGANDVLLNKTENLYLHDLDDIDKFKSDLKNKFSNQGKISQSFTEHRRIRNDNGTYQDKYVFSMKHEYPLVPIGQRATNYKTGITTSSENLAFDFYTGKPTEVLANDGYGNTYLTVTEPAYKHYPAMGLKVKEANPKDKKHMLEQNASTYIYKVDPLLISNRQGLVSGTVQTWASNITIKEEGGIDNVIDASQYNNIWRKKATYSWIGNESLQGGGLSPYSDFQPFDFGYPEGNSVKWEKNGEIHLYDIYSHALEASDINNNFAATKLSYDQHYVYSTVANARYHEFVYSGAEDTPFNFYYGGGAEQANGVEVFRIDENDYITTHTGRKALSLASGTDGGGNTNKAFRYSFQTEPGRSYHASVWVNSTQGRLLYSINGETPVPVAVDPNKKHDSWHLLEMTTPKIEDPSSLSIWCESASGTITFDDYRVHPLDAAMTSYVYNEWGELSFILDNNNLYTEYKYDDMGRLKETYKESIQYGRKKTNDVEYHYARQTN